MLKNDQWTEAVVSENLKGRDCKTLKNFGQGSHLFERASNAMAFKLTGGEDILETVK